MWFWGIQDMQVADECVDRGFLGIQELLFSMRYALKLKGANFFLVGLGDAGWRCDASVVLDLYFCRTT